MPKVTTEQLPLSGLFGVNKPSGPTSMAIINDMKKLINESKLFVEADKLKEDTKGKGKKRSRFKRGPVKIGQGGTLDPLADGVLVVAIGKATKRLGEFLDCVKEYRTTCLLGCATDSYDSEGAQLRLAPWKHVTREQVEEALEKFRGNIMQTPPIFSALKMDGKPLYEYAREGIPLPRPIEARQVTVHELELVEWKGSDHSYRWPEKKVPLEQRKAAEKTLQTVGENVKFEDSPEADMGEGAIPTAFVLRMKVSGGTYVRSIVHDLAEALGSAGHVVTLTRSRQGRFTLEPTEPNDMECVPWSVFEKAVATPGEPDEDGWKEWEREVLAKFEVFEGKGASSSRDS
ncbi:pseudouridine synthase [Panus rudis PR-1116 ss-1]|nr:pseudouridine synthase [Panus rudis PR-1116 ss-1]